MTTDALLVEQHAGSFPQVGERGVHRPRGRLIRLTGIRMG